MKTRSRLLLAAAALALVFPLLQVSATGQAAPGESLGVDLSSPRGPSTGVGEGFLYGISQDGTQPADQLLQPLGLNAFRGGGWFSGGWIRDGYRNGSATKADLDSITAQARRLTRPPYHAQYQVLITDIYGLNGGQPSNTRYPCDNGDCSNWISFLDATVGALQASGLKFAYDIDNEPDIPVFWTRGVNSAQYFRMWDTAYREIRRIAPGAQIVGPSFGFTPQRSPGEWQAWFAHVKAAATVPDMISNHNEGDVDDPVTVAQTLDGDMTAAGITPVPLSSNEYQPADRQTAGVTAWYLARFAQSGYTNAMRGNWVCCTTPNLTGVLTQSGGTWQPTGNWWALRDYADLTGTLARTSGQGSTAIAAAEDAATQRAVAMIGDSNGHTGAASVTFTGLAAVPWLANDGSVNVRVDRIPDQAPLSAPQVVYHQDVAASGGSISVPLTFQAAHDAFAVYLTPDSPGGGGIPSGYHQLVAADDNLCLDVYGDSSAAGAAIDQWTCNGQANQRFRFVPGTGGYGELRAQNSGQDVVVDGGSTAQGTPDVVQEPAGDAAGTRWQPLPQSDGSYEFRNDHSGLCLDLPGGGGSPGRQAGQWPCKNAPGTDQDFVLR